jgi:small subunit ribosomal protein S5
MAETTAQQPTTAGAPAPRGNNARRPGGRGDFRGNNRGGKRDGKGGGRGRGRRDDKPRDDFEARIIDLARVTRVMAGGKRMRFRACVVVGDKKGQLGVGIMKGADVQFAVAKATEKAKRHLIRVKLYEGTIPHRIEQKYASAVVLLKPAKQGTGVIAGGPVRVMMELAGIPNIVSKMKGSGNKINNVMAVMEALQNLKSR